MASIRQDVSADVLPDFRNLGVTARVLIGSNGALLAAAFYASPQHPLDAFLAGATLLEPVLLASLVALYAGSALLARLPYAAGCAAVMAGELLIAGALNAGLAATGASADWGRVLGFAALGTACFLAYFRLFARAYSPALAEARLQALQSRIRPHFLFNSLNAVLSLIRSDPRRAELALQDLAELFRVLMSEGRAFVRLGDEIDLLERYAALEQLRLGERLRVGWEVDAAPQDALMPPLVLQPLLENAIYHGVEPGTGTGEVRVGIALEGDRVRARISNPVLDTAPARRGSHMALDNIRERLLLFFDAEARLDTRVEGGRYEVSVVMPYRVAMPTRSAGNA